MTLTAETLSAIAGALLSLGAAYIPGFSGWFAGLDSMHKRLVMLGLLALAAAGALGLSCAGWGPALGLPAAPGCDAPGALGVLRVFLMALSANQAAYLLAVRRSGGETGEDRNLLAALDRLVPPRR